MSREDPGTGVQDDEAGTTGADPGAGVRDREVRPRTRKKKRKKPEKKTTTLPFGKAALGVGAALWGLAAGTIGAVLQSQVVGRWFAPNQSAAISGIDFQQESFEEYVANTHGDAARFSEGRLARTGLAVFADIKATGLSHHGLVVRGALLDLAHGRHERTELERFTWPYKFSPRAGTSDTKQANIWLALPREPGKYRIVERVYRDGSGEYLGRGLGPTFRVTSNGDVREVGPK
jgi:hypothetical protein